MVIDSDKKKRAEVAETLRGAAYEVLFSPVGSSAVMMAAYNRPSLILLDVQLDDCDGRDVLRALRERVGGIPVVVYSARDYDADRIISSELGAAGYIAKRDVPALLLPLVERVLLRGSSPLAS